MFSSLRRSSPKCLEVSRYPSSSQTSEREPVLGIRLTWAGPAVREGNDVHLVLRDGVQSRSASLGRALREGEHEGKASALRLGKCLLQPRALQEANARLRATPARRGTTGSLKSLKFVHVLLLCRPRWRWRWRRTPWRQPKPGTCRWSSGRKKKSNRRSSCDLRSCS